MSDNTPMLATELIIESILTSYKGGTNPSEESILIKSSLFKVMSTFFIKI